MLLDTINVTIMLFGNSDVPHARGDIDGSQANGWAWYPSLSGPPWLGMINFPSEGVPRGLSKGLGGGGQVKGPERALPFLPAVHTPAMHAKQARASSEGQRHSGQQAVQRSLAHCAGTLALVANVEDAALERLEAAGDTEGKVLAGAADKLTKVGPLLDVWKEEGGRDEPRLVEGV